MIQVYTDGGSRGNPGEAAYAFLIYKNGKNIFEMGKKLGTTTNNVAEYTAVIEGLKKAREFDYTAEVFSDSELVVRQINGEYKVKQRHLKELFKRVKEIEAGFKLVRYYNNPREHPKQKIVDKLVNLALES